VARKNRLEVDRIRFEAALKIDQAIRTNDGVAAGIALRDYAAGVFLCLNGQLPSVRPLKTREATRYELASWVTRAAVRLYRKLVGLDTGEPWKRMVCRHLRELQMAAEEGVRVEPGQMLEFAGGFDGLGTARLRDSLSLLVRRWIDTKSPGGILEFARESLISRNVVYKIIRGEPVSRKTLQDLSIVLEIPFEDLLSLAPIPRNEQDLNTK
jgi:hypothetical protein